MAFTDDEKLNFAKQALKTKIMAIAEWPTFKSLVENITPAQFKNLIKVALAAEKVKRQEAADAITSEVTDYQALHDEVDAL